MGINDQLFYGLQTLIGRAGKQIRIRYYNETIGSVYDDELVLTPSGNDVWTSGIVLPINNSKGTYENLLIEQGKMNPWAQRMYVHGSLLFESGALRVKVGVGSPNEEQFSIVSIGGITAETNNSKIYKKMYIERLPNGSLLGE